jgi:transposase-like protein
VKAIAEKLHCKRCGSENIVGYGSYHGIPRFWCKDCKRKFADNNALPKYKTPVEQVTHALASFYNGNSLNDIKNELESQYGTQITEAAVYYWVRRQSDKAIAATSNLQPNVGDTWIADETSVPVGTGKRNYWLIDVIDRDTRFLLATRLSKTRTIRDIELTMLKAKERAGKSPKTVLSDGWHAYPDGIERAFGSDTKHIQSNPFADKNSTVLVERVQGSLKDRTKVFRALKKKDTAQTILDGWVTYYNFSRPHLSLRNEMTPAEAGGINYFTNWGDFVRSQLPQPAPAERLPRNRNDIPTFLKTPSDIPMKLKRQLGITMPKF